MKRTLLSILALLVFAAPIATFAQKSGGHSRPSTPPSASHPHTGPTPKQPPARDHRPDGKNYDRDHHRMFRRSDLEERGGVWALYWNGFWFGCDVWPEWAFGQDIYFIQDAGGQWFVVSYSDPSLRCSIVIVY